MKTYDEYNREERAICSHLFRLLHEGLEKEETSPLWQFLNRLEFRIPTINLSSRRFENIGIFCEVALIRDAFQNLKPSVNQFMDQLTTTIIRQENIQNCRLYSELPEILRNPKLTHPKQIRQKASAENISLSKNEETVYGAVQGMFNAKPDLAITIDNLLLVFEAKFTEPFDEIQLIRTKNIAEIWASLLYQDLGFSSKPQYEVIKLGAKNFEPHITWTDIAEIAELTYSEQDRTRCVLNKGVELLKAYNLE